MLSRRTLLPHRYSSVAISGYLRTTNIAIRATSSQAGVQQPAPNATASHTSDSYSKDVDATPPDDPKIHRVDPDSETSQKSYEAPKGKYSEAGVRSAWENGWKDKDRKEK